MDRLKSKKFWILVLTLIVAMVGGGGLDPAIGDALHLDPLAVGIAGLASTAYITIQGRIDRANVLARAVEKLDLNKVRELLIELEQHDTKLASAREEPTSPSGHDDDFPY